MAVTQQITDAIIEQSILQAVKKVSQTMLNRDVTLVSQHRTPLANAKYEIIDTVGFAGDIAGSVSLCLHERFAFHAIGLMLGILETALLYFAGQTLETAVANSARLIRTGQAQTRPWRP